MCFHRCKSNRALHKDGIELRRLTRVPCSKNSRTLCPIFYRILQRYSPSLRYWLAEFDFAIHNLVKTCHSLSLCKFVSLIAAPFAKPGCLRDAKMSPWETPDSK